VSYTLGTNTTGYGSNAEDAERTKELLANRWQAEAQNVDWKDYMTFARVQNAVDGAIVDEKDAIDSSEYSVRLDVSVKPFPWLGYDYNLGGIIAAAVFSIIGALAFMSNVVIIMKSVVVEKELRLREGMQMMGMSTNTYWLSWFFTHLVTAMCTVVLICLIGMYPFEYTNPFLQFVFYTLWVISIILWNYMLSTVFSRSITASVVGCFVYVISMAPAIAVRITHENGSTGWIASCLLPGGTIIMWGHVLSVLELAKEGVTFDTLAESVSRDVNFSAGTVIGMTALDCVIYASMTWYLDKVWPTEFGQRLEPWFLFTRAYWRGEKDDAASDDQKEIDAAALEKAEEGVTFEKLTPEQTARAPVRIRGLRKTFKNGVTAVDDLTVTFAPSQVSGLLGHNGAGKTTTISILTGMLNASGGDAKINGRSIKTDMPTIRASLGICPQFDVLWPTLTVKEHLELYAAFGGMPKKMIGREVIAAVNEVALSEKLAYKTGLLSGGQRRKLSLAIAFIGRPKVVFLDEPTSGMDPYSRRFTWDVIRRRAAKSSILLTTHFLDEADLLCDRVAIMSAGKLACVGSPVFLKNRYGTGYHLTLARSEGNAGGNGDAASVLSLVAKHVPAGAVASDVGAELSFTLPTDQTRAFPELFKELDANLQRLGFSSYGISCTTLEEVFLSVARGGVGGKHVVKNRKSLDENENKTKALGAAAAADESPLVPASEDASDDHPDDVELRAGYSRGWSLLGRQISGLLWKRWLNWTRDAWSILIQIIVPVLFFVLALVLAGLEYGANETYYDIAINRGLLGGRPTIISARDSDAEAAAVIAQFTADAYVKRSYQSQVDCRCFCPADSAQLGTSTVYECCMHDPAAATTLATAAGFATNIQYCGAQSTYSPAGGACATDSNGMDVYGDCVGSADSFDGYLWSITEQRQTCDSQRNIGCDAIHIEQYTNAASSVYTHTVYAHQSAYHSIPATLNEINSAILRRRTGDSNARIAVVNEWLPAAATYGDGDVVDTQNDSTFITSLFVVMGAAVLTSSLVVFPVYERRNNSKHLQMVSGVNKMAYWHCHWLADLAQMAAPVAAVVCLFAAFNIAQYRGQLEAISVLLISFIASSIGYTHLLGFYFSNEFYAFVGTVGVKLFLGVITTAAGMVVEVRSIHWSPYDPVRVVNADP
jgi:ABC-type multidrug transport system ATPase subunit